MNVFTAAVADAFGLGSPSGVVVDAMVGSANRLWRFATPSGAFVVKELSHDSPDDLPRRRRAAEFEWAVFESKLVPMPEPVLSVTGEMIVVVNGSRGGACAVRVHRWFDGDTVEAPDAVLGAAGASLRAIQRAGAKWSSEERGSLIRWWDVDPREFVARLETSALADLEREPSDVALRAMEVIAAADGLPGAWIYSHCDHKPENALVVRGGLAVLDWDECSHCHPRLEAVEAALRWADADAPRREAFEAFLTGYAHAGGDLAGLAEPDFGKWIAALLGWFCFQARRALGEWPSDTPAERRAAEKMARAALMGLRRSLDALPTWSSWW